MATKPMKKHDRLVKLVRKLVEVIDRGGNKTHLYVILTHFEFEAFNIIIAYSILIFDLIVFVLFNPRSSFSHVSVKFFYGLDFDCKFLCTLI